MSPWLPPDARGAMTLLAFLLLVAALIALALAAIAPPLAVAAGRPAPTVLLR